MISTILISFLFINSFNQISAVKYGGDDDDWKYCDKNGNTKVPLDLPGNCPKIVYIDNFKIKSIQGYHYTLYTTRNHTNLGCDGDCLNSYAARFDDDTFRFADCCRLGCDNACGNDIGSGKLYYEGGADGSFIYETNGVKTRIYVLDMGKDASYFIFYGCWLSMYKEPQEALFVLARYTRLSQRLKNHIFNVIRWTGIDVTKIIGIHQTDCPNQPI